MPKQASRSHPPAFRRNALRALPWLAVGIGLALPIVPKAAILQMTDIESHLATGKCPEDLNDVRDFTTDEKCGKILIGKEACLKKLDAINAKLEKYNRQMATCRLKRTGSGARPPGGYNEVYVVEKEFVIPEPYQAPYRNAGGIKYLDMSGTVFVKVCPADTARVQEVTSRSYCAGVGPSAQKAKCLRETNGLLDTIRAYNKFMSFDCGGTLQNGMRQLLPWGAGQMPAGPTAPGTRGAEQQEENDDRFDREIDQDMVRQQRVNERLKSEREAAAAAETARILEMINQGIAAGRGSSGGGSTMLNANQCAQLVAQIRQIERVLGTGDGSAASRQQVQNALNQNVAAYNSRCR